MADVPQTAGREPQRVLVLGATGSIGRAAVRALIAAGHETVCFLRPRRDGGDPRVLFPEGARLRFGDVTDTDSIWRDGFAGEHFDVLVSCLASRTGLPEDAWAIDYQAHVDALGQRSAQAFATWFCCRPFAYRSPSWPFSTPSSPSRNV
jgi:divinyl chlorophyllide a 8-vinyl-reductase